VRKVSAIGHERFQNLSKSEDFAISKFLESKFVELKIGVLILVVKFHGHFDEVMGEEGHRQNRSQPFQQRR